MASKTTDSKVPTVVWCAVAALLVMVGTGFLIRAVPTLQHFVLKASGDGIEAGFSNETRVEEFLNAWVGSPSALPVLQAWLHGRLGMVDPDGSRILQELINRCPEIADRAISGYQEQVAKCDGDPVLGPIRRLSEDRAAPFQRRAVKVRIGTPDKGPPSGVAYTCYGGRLEHKRLRLLVPEIPRGLEVQVRGGFSCDPGQTFPDLHVNGKEARTLLGRPTREIEEVFALVI